MRDFGNISDIECQRYQQDLDAVRRNELSFRDFFVKLQAGGYSRPISQRKDEKTGQLLGFCEQVMFSDEDAEKIKSLADFDANISKLKNIRIRQVTSGGSFSSGTKAKFKLSLPIRARYVMGLQRTQAPVNQLIPNPWRWQTVPGPESTTPITGDITISMLTMYHPSPLRLENVQHDAVLSLNDPSDPTAKVVILVPLKSSNMNDPSVDFFTKIAKHITTIQTPDSITGYYPETDIPTGNDWNIKSLFWLDESTKDNLSKVTDAFYTWTGATAFRRVEKSRSSTEIRYGWVADGEPVRYFMLATPVSISSSDLSFLTRSLPPTPSEEAIHMIPDPSSKTAANPKILYKQATGPAADAGCGVTRERMTNWGQGGALDDLLVDEKGTPLSDKDSCDPFAMNTRNAIARPSLFTPTKVATWIFNILLVIAVALGAWLALFLVVNKDYDYKFRDFSDQTGKVVGKLAKKFLEKAPEPVAVSSGPPSVGAVPSIPKIPSLSGLAGKVPGMPKSLSGLASLAGKPISV